MIGQSLKRMMLPECTFETYSQRDLQGKARRSLHQKKMEHLIHLLVFKCPLSINTYVAGGKKASPPKRGLHTKHASKRYLTVQGQFKIGKNGHRPTNSSK